MHFPPFPHDFWLSTKAHKGAAFCGFFPVVSTHPIAVFRQWHFWEGTVLERFDFLGLNQLLQDNRNPTWILTYKLAQMWKPSIHKSFHLGSYGLSISILVHSVVSMTKHWQLWPIPACPWSIPSELDGFNPWWVPGVAILKHHLHLWIHRLEQLRGFWIGHSYNIIYV